MSSAPTYRDFVTASCGPLQFGRLYPTAFDAELTRISLAYMREARQLMMINELAFPVIPQRPQR